LKIRIKRQEEREEEMEKKQKKREEDLLSIEKNYNTLNEEVDMLRGKFSDLKNKYLLKCQ
jgi:polyhydroxyalkanoate synthesis regulator phasin